MEKIHISKAKSLAGNLKISHTILCMIFSILFIFTALNIPITAYARQASTASNQYDTICRPLCGQTQAFWSADKRNGGGAVENRTAQRPSTMAHSPRGGGLGLVLPQTFVFRVIPSIPTVYRLSQLHTHSLPLVFVLKSMNTFLFPHFFHFFLKE